MSDLTHSGAQCETLSLCYAIKNNRENSDVFKYSTLFGFMLLFIFVGLFSSVNASQFDEAHCGDRITADEVLVVDLEPYSGQEDLLYEKLHEQAGTYSLSTEKPVLVNWVGSKFSIVQRIGKSAATNGCDLVVLLGSVAGESRPQTLVSRPIRTRYLIVHIGKRDRY
jgi:hypothetical protein